MCLKRWVPILSILLISCVKSSTELIAFPDKYHGTFDAVYKEIDRASLVPLSVRIDKENIYFSSNNAEFKKMEVIKMYSEGDALIVQHSPGKEYTWHYKIIKNVKNIDIYDIRNKGKKDEATFFKARFSRRGT